MGSGGSHDASVGKSLYQNKDTKSSKPKTKENKSQEQAIFQEVKDDILNDLEPDDVIGHLRDSGSLPAEDYQRITSSRNRREKSKRLYESLHRRLPESFHAFVIALQKTSNKHLLAKVEGQATWYYPKGEAVKQGPMPEIKPVCTSVDGKQAGKPSTLLLDLSVKAKEAEVDFNQMMKVLEDPLIKCRINDKLFKASHCLIDQVDVDPIILHLRPLGMFRMQTFEAKAGDCVKDLVAGVIARNTSVTSGRQFDKDEVFEASYGIRCQYADAEETPESAVNEIKKNRELLVEELEAVSYLKSLDFLAANEQGEIRSLGSRRQRAERLVAAVLKTGEGAAEEFITVLLEDPLFGPLGRQHMTHVPGIRSMQALAGNYAALVDQILPEVVAEASVEAGILPRGFHHSAVWKRARGDRSLRAMMVMQGVLSGETDKAGKLCDILRKQGYVLASDNQVAKKKA